MPHLHLETTADLPENGDIPEILEALVATFSQIETVKPPTIKAYHTLRSVWMVGEGHPEGFAHLQVCVLAGRPVELRQKMADAMMGVMKASFEQSLSASEVAVTVEVREMDPATYRA
jgi:5-carboxymethyl-2-hydroxymuconate isomerase